MALRIDSAVDGAGLLLADGNEEEAAALLAEFHLRPSAEVKISLSGCESPYHLPECSCVLSLKKGRYAESRCEAHKLTLRNSRPCPEPLGSPVVHPNGDLHPPVRFLASPSRKPLTALLSSGSHHSESSRSPLTLKPKAMMKESKSMGALPPSRGKESIERDAVGEDGLTVSLGNKARMHSGGLLPSLSTSMLLHLSPAKSPSPGDGDSPWSLSFKSSSSQVRDLARHLLLIAG